MPPCGRSSVPRGKLVLVAAVLVQSSKIMAADDDTTTELQLTMKLFINAGAQRVLFAETSRDVMDFLYSLLVSPDTAISLDDATLRGCIDNLVDSLEELDDLDGRPPSPAPLLLQQPHPQKRARRFFLCGDRRGAGCDGYVAARSGLRCPSCGGTMDAEAPPGAPGAGWSGDAAAAAPAPAPTVEAGTLTCTLMDDLSIGPTIGYALVAAGVRGNVALQEATVRLGRKEGLQILKISLHSSSVLTNVFLRGKALVL